MPPVRKDKKSHSTPNAPVPSPVERKARKVKKRQSEKQTDQVPLLEPKETVDETADYPWHPDVDYTPLIEPERQNRVILNLYTIFSLGSRNGLSVYNVRQMAQELGMNELAMLSPVKIRNAIGRWNTTIYMASNDGKICDHLKCKQPAVWGQFMGDPTNCERHKQEGTMLLVPGRLIPLTSGLHGKYFMTEPLFSRIFSPSFSENPSNSVDTMLWDTFFAAAADDLDEMLAGLV